MTIEDAQLKVKEFHSAFDILINDTPTVPDRSTLYLRANLIEEESREFLSAINRPVPDLIEIADALADILYVVLGSAVSLGLDMSDIFNEVHRSNMSKVGGYKRADGKWVKPATYSPADLATIIESQKGRKNV